MVNITTSQFLFFADNLNDVSYTMQHISLPSINPASTTEEHVPLPTWPRIVISEDLPLLSTQNGEIPSEESIGQKHYDRLQNLLIDSFDAAHEKSSIESSQTQALLEENTAKMAKLENEMQIQRKQLDIALKKNYSIQEINNAFSNEIKIQKQLRSKLKKDNDIAEDLCQIYKKDLDESLQRNLLLVNQKREIGIHLDMQIQETALAEKSLVLMNKEVVLLEGSIESTKKHWDETVAAMSKRDRVFQTVEESKVKLGLQLKVTENELKSVKQEFGFVTKNLRNREQDFEKLNDLLMETKSELIKKNLDDGFQISKDARLVQEVANLSKVNVLQSGEIERKNIDIHEYRSKITSMKNEFEQRMLNHVPKESIQKQLESNRKVSDLQTKQIERREETRNISLRLENTKLKTWVENKGSQIVTAEADNNRLSLFNKHVTEHYTKLYGETKFLIYTIERKEHELNQLKSKMSAHAADSSGTYSIEIASLKKEVNDAKIEMDDLRKMWLESQKLQLSEKEKMSRLEEDCILLTVNAF